MKNEVLNFVADVKNKKPASPLLYGLFFEDINHSLDGGLNANLVQNGSFDFCAFSYNKPVVKNEYFNLKFWEIESGNVTTEKPISENKPYSLKIDLKDSCVIKNCGYELVDNKNYIYLNDHNFTASFFYSSNKDVMCEAFFEYANGTKTKPVQITLTKTNKYVLKEFSISTKSKSFAKLVFKFFGNATLYLTHFKLIPFNYFKTAKNKYNYGKFNPALVQALDMGAKFMRFPGGCLVEGDASLDYLYEWEKTIGPTEQRISKPSVWNYLQSNEIGFFEYFCLCEDLHLSPLPVHHVGLICQIRTEVTRHLGYIAYSPTSREFKEKVVDSVAHLIYFALGNVNSKDKTEKLWANKRKEMGHTKPFNLKMIALGNENWDKIYFRNFKACIDALQNYDYCNKKVNLLETFGVQILTSSGVDINPQDTNPSWRYLNKNYTNLIVDEHVYNTPSWFADNYYRYDYYNPNLSKVFMGEYACHTDADGLGRLGGTNNFISALSEAVFVLGMENNPDIVKMSCYAPLICKVGQANWNPDLIYFDKEKIHLTPNYAVQSAFAKNYGKYGIKLYCERNFDNMGKFAAKLNKNEVESITFEDLKFKPIKVNLINNETDKNLKNYYVKIKFKHLVDGFSLSFGKTGNFKYLIHYNIQDKALYFEKIVNGLRMTLERLLDIDLKTDICIKYTEQEIVVYSLQKTLTKLTEKKIWKTNTNVFTSLTFDNKFIYLKVVNVGDDTKANFDLSSLIKTGTSAKHIVLTEKENGFKEQVKTIKVNPNFTVALKEKSINIFKIEK